MTNDQKAKIKERIEAAAYKKIPGGFRNLLCAFYEGGRWWIYLYDKCVVWSVDSPDLPDPKSPLTFQKLPPKQQNEALQRYIRSLKSPYKERRTVKYQIEVAAYGQIPGNISMSLAAYREHGKWIVVDHVSGSVWEVTRPERPGPRSAFRFRKVWKGEE
jgi:hypothetical protein